MEEEFDLSKVVSDATKANADRDFYLAMATQSKATSPIAAYLAGAAGAKAATLQGKLQANKDAQAAADKFTKRRDDLLLNMHAIARDKDSNPATKAGMIGLLAREIGLQPKEYDAENNILNVSDANGNMLTFDFSEQLSEKDALNLRKLLAQARGAEALAGKREYDLNKALSGESGKGTSGTSTTLSDFNRRYKDVIEKLNKKGYARATEKMTPEAKKTMYESLLLIPENKRATLKDLYIGLSEEFGQPWQNREAQSTMPKEEKTSIKYF